MLHYGYVAAEGKWAFRAAQAEATLWKDDKYGDLLRLEFTHRQPPWKIGQHFFLCFTEGSIWQSHPFTPLSLPVADARGEVKHSYILRAKGGETRNIAGLVARKMVEMGGKEGETATTGVILQGPYGEGIVEGLTPEVNVFCVAGGTGITYVLPVLLSIVRDGRVREGRNIGLVWAVKRARDTEWVKGEMDELRKLGGRHNVGIRIFVTDDDAVVGGMVEGEKEERQVAVRTSSSASSAGRSEEEMSGRPNLQEVVSQFIGEVAQGPTRVFGSGPPGMIGELRGAVAKANSGRRVWRREEMFDVSLFCDDRLEW